MGDEVAAYHHPANQKVKKGWQTTEFWLSVVIITLGALLQTGLWDWMFGALDPRWAWVDKVVGSLLEIAAAFGYTQARAKIKIQTAIGAAQVAQSNGFGPAVPPAG